MLALLQAENNPQYSLIHVIDRDDQILLNSREADWYQILYQFPWPSYRIDAATYYDALYEFNLQEAEKRAEAMKESSFNPETKDEARERLLFERVTMKTLEERETMAILYQDPKLKEKKPITAPESIAPGQVPERVAGKKPKCFFALFKSFLGATLMGFPPEPEMVHQLLQSNPSFARVCGFVPKTEKDEYCYRHVPSLRKLQQFDQIMRDSGLWAQIKWDEVGRNLKEGLIEKENELVGDTTHYYAYSSFETVEYQDEKEKKQKKSQSGVTKHCRCTHWDDCPHPWELRDEGAGTIVKSNKRMLWGHKASLLGFPKQGIPLDAVAVSDAATHDGKTLLPHVERLFEHLPQLRDSIERILYDSACDDKDLKKQFKEQYGIDLKASFNPGRKKPITENLPRGIEKITPSGVPICHAGLEMDYQGMRMEAEKFIYRAPLDEKGRPVCLQCPHQAECCPNAKNTGRMITVSFDQLSNINPEDPPMAKRFKAIMTRRPSVERMIKRLKCDLSDDRLSKRGNDSFQAYLDKTMIAFHLLLRYQQQE